MSIKEKAYEILDSSTLGKAILEARRQLRHNSRIDSLKNSPHSFIDRSKGSDKLCIILAGYKEPLWDNVFARIKRAAPKDMDICIMTSGLENEKLKKIAEEYDWSYLSTEVNHLSLIQNLAIELHRNAEWIFKLDEDMFLPETFFEPLLETYHMVQDESMYEPAFVSPLINVSCYGHLRLLEKLDLVEAFRATGLTTMKITDGLHHNKAVLENPQVSEFMWGAHHPELRNIDTLTERFMQDELTYTVCPVRYSIGAILFTRTAWEEFGGFPLTFVGSIYGLGDDEEHICHYACFTGKAMVVSDNVIVGHLGYGPQTNAMLDYYEQHQDRFALPAQTHE